MKKLTLGASIKFDRVQLEGLNEENLPELMESMFFGQDTDKVDWSKMDLELWQVIQKDFFFVNKKALNAQKNLAKDILSMMVGLKNEKNSEKPTG